MSRKKISNMDFIGIIGRIKALKSLRYDYEVARLLNITKTAFGERKHRNSLPEDKIALFCERESINMDWILKGKGAIYREGEFKAEDLVYVPQVKGEISAGGGLTPDETIELRIAFRKDWIRRKGNPERMSLIKVRGDSMEPALFSGDMVLVDHGRNYADPQGGLYAIAIGEEIMVKRLQPLFPERKIKIISDNPKYEPIVASPEEVNINGKIVWFCREIER